MKISKEDLKHLNSGDCAKVLHNKNIILKEYWKETRLKDRIDPKIFALLKEINLHIL